MPAGSSTSESEYWWDLFFHSGNEYDFVRTTGNLEREQLDFGIKTHSLSNLTTRLQLACSGEPIPGNMNDPMVDVFSKRIAGRSCRGYKQMGVRKREEELHVLYVS